MLSATGRRLRAAATALGVALLLAGTVRGSDDAFPFGPFRMYAGVNDPNGVANSARVEAVRADGRVVRVPDAATGLRRAEIEGQLPRLVANPDLLRALAVAHSRRRPHEPRFVEVRVVNRVFQLRDGRTVGFTDHVLASWKRP